MPEELRPGGGSPWLPELEGEGREWDRYGTSLAAAPTTSVTREAKRGTSIKSPGNTDTAEQAHVASLETAVKAHIQRKRIMPEKALHTKQVGRELQHHSSLFDNYNARAPKVRGIWTADWLDIGHWDIVDIDHCPLGVISWRGYWTFGERKREFTPFQPHRADAGAARTSPGRSHIRVLVTV